VPLSQSSEKQSRRSVTVRCGRRMLYEKGRNLFPSSACERRYSRWKNTTPTRKWPSTKHVKVLEIELRRWQPFSVTFCTSKLCWCNLEVHTLVRHYCLICRARGVQWPLQWWHCYFSTLVPHDRNLTIRLRWFLNEPTILHPWKFGEAVLQILGLNIKREWNRSKT